MIWSDLKEYLWEHLFNGGKILVGPNISALTLVTPLAIIQEKQKMTLAATAVAY